MFRLSCCLKQRSSISSKCSKILANSFNTYIRPSTMTVQQQNRKGSNLSMLNINPAVTAVEYAVRGPIVIKASEIEQELIEV